MYLPPPAIAAVILAEVLYGGWIDHRLEVTAQVYVESAYRPNAASRYASGLAQFTPATWGDWSGRTKPSCEGRPPTDPACSVRTQIVYMRWLLRRFNGSWHNAWRGYNGGAGWLDRERRAAAGAGLNPNDTGHMERFCQAVGRSAASCKENTAYPRKIRRVMEIIKDA